MSNSPYFRVYFDYRNNVGAVKPLYHRWLLIKQGHDVDINVRAFRVVREAVSGASSAPTGKKVSAQKGGLVGGPSRAKSISRERRVEIAKKASAARWRKRDIAR